MQSPGHGDYEGIIPGLPDDLALMCLARISHGYHGLLECVCKKWRDVVKSRDFVCLKAREGWCGKWIFALTSREGTTQFNAYDPDADRWHPMPRMPIPNCSHQFGFSCVSVCKRFLMIGGSYTTHSFDLHFTTSNVILFDPFEKQWSRASSMRTPRTEFACAVILDKVYVAGGCNLYDAGGLASAEVYDPLKDRWEDLPPMPIPLFECFGVSYEGQFHVFGRQNHNIRLDTYIRFHPAEQRWHAVNGFQPFSILMRFNTASLNDSIYALADDEARIQTLDARLKRWRTLGVVPPVFLPDDQRPLRRLGFGFVGLERYLFVVGGMALKFDANARAYGISKLNSALFCDLTKLPLEWQEAQSMPRSSGGSAMCFALGG